MPRKSVRNSALLALAATSAHLATAMPWLEPRITPMGMMPIDGVSPVPTRAPGREVGGSFFDNWLNKKACVPIPDTVCGYVTNNVANSLTCGAGNNCVRDGFRFGCCSEANIALCSTIYTICGNYVDTCGAACQANPRVLKCSNLARPFCQTFTFSGGVLGYNCATVGGMTSVAWVRDIYPSGCKPDGNSVVNPPPATTTITKPNSVGGSTAPPVVIVVTPTPTSQAGGGGDGAVSPPPPASTSPAASNPPPQTSPGSPPTQQPTVNVNTNFNPTIFVTVAPTDYSQDTSAIPVAATGTQVTFTFVASKSASGTGNNGNGIGVGVNNPTDSSSTSPTPTGKSGIGTGAIAGIAIGGVAVIAAIAGGIFYFCCVAGKRKRDSDSDQPVRVPGPVGGGAAGGASTAYGATAEKITLGPQDNYQPTPVTHQAYPVPAAGGYYPQGRGYQQQQYQQPQQYGAYQPQPGSPTGYEQDPRYSIPAPPPPQYGAGVVGNVVPPNLARGESDMGRDGRMSPASELGEGQHSREPSGGWGHMGQGGMGRVHSPELHGAEGGMHAGRVEVDGRGVGGPTYR